MKILVGTTNKNKVVSVASYLPEEDIEWVTPDQLGITLDIVENGDTPLDNAILKAQAYYRASKLPTIAFDSGLYFLDLSEDDPIQPKTNVRRVQGKRLNDEEMIAYYSALAHRFQGRLLAGYRNGYCIVQDEDHMETYMDTMESARLFAFWLCDQPHVKRTPGWPLDSISIDAMSGKYFHDLEEEGEYSIRGQSFAVEERQAYYEHLRQFYRKGFHL